MLSERLYRLATGQTGGQAKARAFGIHAVSLTATKTADGLIDPKLVLSWLLSAVGAPGYLIGGLVPVRESGALLPQLALARWIQGARRRRWFWVGGSLVQGLAALGIAASVVLLDGTAAGFAVVGLLALLAVARSSCSASYKDVLARTVDTGARGTVAGLAGTVASVAVFAFAAFVALGVIPREIWPIACAVALAGGLWLLAAATFGTLDEPPATPEADGAASVNRLTAPLREDAEFRVYLATRALLIATALAPPFIVLLGNSGGAGDDLGNLGALLLGSSAAAILSSYLWGRLSDRSSRRTLALSGAAAALVLGAASVSGFLSGGLGPGWAAAMYVFGAQIAYFGVRAGRATHLADMDTQGRKPRYTALSNTLIGVLLLAGGGFGLLADVAGPETVLAVFAAMGALAALVALRLSEVQSA